MATRILIPAFEAKVGDWDYYICSMKYAQVATQVSFAYELGGNQDLNTLIQRGLSNRTDDIRAYLLRSSHRFLGGLIIASWGGSPTYQKVQILDADSMVGDIDQDFGVLTFDGTQQYFVLDGQHRLRAIKEAIKQDPNLGKEDICVLLVSHFDTPEGREKTRRLFTNINRNAKTTTAAENIALDEDDGYAILTRRFLTDHDFLREPGRVRVFTRREEGGAIKLAGIVVPKTDARAFTTITVLDDLLEQLGMGLGFTSLSERPTDDVLEDSYGILSTRIDQLLNSCDSLRERLESAASARDVRAPKKAEADGHPLMRPVIQRVVCRVVRRIIDQGQLDWDEAMSRLSALDWSLGKAPWLAVFNPATNRMITSKENAGLLGQLLQAHLAPPSGQFIGKTRKEFKDVVGYDYPVSRAELEKLIKESTGVESLPEVSADMPPLPTD